MYIEPNTVIKILKNVPLDNTYNHTIYFEYVSEQQEFFNSRVKYTLTNQTYQRKERGYMRVQIKAENLYNCNYLMYQNSSFGNKWFYAFITGVEYINNEVSEISFEIDVMQTWLFDVRLEESFVEREHSETDELFSSLTEENIEIGEYVLNKNSVPLDHNFARMDVAVFSGWNLDLSSSDHGTIARGNPINGTYNGVTVKTFSVQDHDGAWYIDDGSSENEMHVLNTYLEGMTTANKEDSILSIVMFPHELIHRNAHGDLDAYAEPKDYSVFNVSNLSYLDGYKPKNNKLYNSPYVIFYVGLTDGQGTILQPEYMGDECEVTAFPLFSPTPQITFVPHNYKGMTYYWEGSLNIDNFPQCSYVIDSYRAWVAQGGFKQTMLNNARGVASGTFETARGYLGVMGGNSPSSVLGGALSMAHGLTESALSGAQTGLDIAIAKNLPPSIRGNASSSSLYANQRVGLIIQERCLKAEKLKIIDDYFSLYGYATKRVKKPNRNVRPHWTFTKTIGCNVVGDAPADDVNKICSIYDNGITFWRHGNEVGHYDLDNSPTT